MKTKTTTVVINGRELEVDKKELSFAEIVELAFGTTPSGDNIIFTITYKRGHGDKPDGTLVEGDSVKVKEGMIFNVTRTDKS
jgi:hypothetical protein